MPGVAVGVEDGAGLLAVGVLPEVGEALASGVGLLSLGGARTLPTELMRSRASQPLNKLKLVRAIKPTAVKRKDLHIALAIMIGGASCFSLILAGFDIACHRDIAVFVKEYNEGLYYV